MGRKNVILIIILVFSIVARISNAEFLSNSRKLAATSSVENPNVTVSSIPSSVDGIGKNNETSPPSTTGEKNPKDDQVINITPPAKPPTDTKQNDSPEDEVNEKDKGEKISGESCDGMEQSCQDEKVMVACVKSFDSVSKAVALLIQNKGENDLRVDLTYSSLENQQKVMEIPKLQTEQVNITLADVGNGEIKLNAGNGYCVLHADLGAPLFQANYFQWNASYSKFMKPIYGAYLVLLITLIAGGVCGVCWFSKRKRTNEVPYQELEMSMPESVAAVETSEGWDEVWDDDWDEEKAVTSSALSVSANGLTCRTLKEDGSDDWND